MQIPHTDLSTETLRALVEDFASRDGTDYGETELSLEEKVNQIINLLDSGKMIITYDPDTESCAIQRP